MVESRPIIVFKNDYEPFKVIQLPSDDSDIIYIDLKLKSPKIGNVVFKDPVPKDIAIASNVDNSILLIDEGKRRFDNLPVGTYKLVSDTYVVRNNIFVIKSKRTTKSSPSYFTINEITEKRDYYLKQRRLYLQIFGGGIAYRSFITIWSSYLYNQYSSDIDKADERHKKIENLDNQKPVFDVLSGIAVFPIIFYHAKFLEMERWLKE